MKDLGIQLVSRWRVLLIFALVMSAALLTAAMAQTEQPVVQAVLFHSPPCSFCRQIVEQDLPPAVARFGSRLQILTVDVNTEAGKTFYQAALQANDLKGYVPLLFVGNTHVGGVNIPNQLPALVDEYLEQGGAGYPALPGLKNYLAAVQLTPTPEAQPELLARPLLPELSQPVPGRPVVRAVMLWMDGCLHCHIVLEDVLPPLQRQYADQLEIVLVELVTLEDIDSLYQLGAAFGLEREEIGVPFLVIGEQALLGDQPIADELPGLIERYLAAGGVEIPTLEALSAVLPEQVAQTEAFCAPATPCADLPAVEPARGAAASAALPPASNGFTLAIGVMAGMLGALVYTGMTLARGLRAPQPARNTRPLASWRSPAFVLLCLAGFGVAGYLAYVETTLVRAICGPVGDCNAVQASPYARLFGVLPVGVLGLVGYLAILAGWGYARLGQSRLARIMPVLVFGLALFGVLFSLYLTFLEPFVIRAVCIWCIISAMIMTLLLLLTLHPALQALQNRKEIGITDVKT